MATASFRFGDGYYLDTARLTLWRGQERVKLGPTRCSILACLVRRRRSFVEAREISKAIGRILSPQTVRVHMHAIRHAIGDDEQNLFIANDRHSSYAFVAEAVEVDAHPSLNPAELSNRANLYKLEPCDSGILPQVLVNLERDGWQVYTTERGQGISNLSFDVALLADKPDIEFCRLTERWYARDHYDPDLEAFVAYQASGKEGVFKKDIPKVRLASEILWVSAVDIQQTDYLSSAMTDQLGWNRVRTKRSGREGRAETIRDVDAFLDLDTFQLKSFAENNISNQLGASTLAFSSDGYLMILYQNELNRRSSGTLVPSGSGSMDWKDVDNSDTTQFLSLIRYAAQRELREECSLEAVETGADRRRGIDSDVLVTGYTRLLSGCGKPEFYCLGYIAAKAAEIRSRTLEEFIDSIIPAQVGRARLNGERPSNEIACISERYLAKKELPMSFPLQHSLKLLVDLCKDKRAASAIDVFIHEAIQRLGG
jgi:DNA-binding winged helix-turn-helix (wHTH) protein